MKKATISGIVAALFIIFSCSGKRTVAEHDPSGSGDGKPTGVVQMDPGTNHENVMKMLKNMNDLSLGLYKKLSSENADQNLAFSPASLNMAMAIVYSGARGNTKQQMSNVFGFDQDHDTFHPLYHAYMTEILNIGKDTLTDFNLANRVFLEQSYPVLDEFVDQVMNWHGGAFEKTDFRNFPLQAENRINSWVEEQTRNRIRDLIPTGSLDDLTRLVLVNALYIKSDWKYPFNKELTREKDFRLPSGATMRTDFMNQRKEGIPWFENEDFIAIELPYTTPDLSLLMIRPNREVVENISNYVPDGETYRHIIENLRNEEVIIEIPSYKIESTFSLVEPLRNAGLTDAFDFHADLSGISGERDLEISDILQKVFFEIDEEGSEAAAATAIVIVTTSVAFDPEPKLPKRFNADRPFLFILKENRFQTPLFIGQFTGNE